MFKIPKEFQEFEVEFPLGFAVLGISLTTLFMTLNGHPRPIDVSKIFNHLVMD